MSTRGLLDRLDPNTLSSLSNDDKRALASRKGWIVRQLRLQGALPPKPKRKRRRRKFKRVGARLTSKIEAICSVEAYTQRLDLHELVGIYFLFCRRKLQYIGQSDGAEGRMGCHKRAFELDEVRFLPIKDLEKRLIMESALIKFYQPEFNRAAKKQPLTRAELDLLLEMSLVEKDDIPDKWWTMF